MASLQSKFMQAVKGRGYIADCTDTENLDSLLAQCEDNDKPLIAYIGFDCTAPSLHVGSLVQIMILRRLQQCGHKPIVLMGGATTKIGDPSGKDESRKMLADEDIEANKQSIQKVFTNFLKFESSFDSTTTNAFMVDNADWLEGMEYIAFLREYGPLLSVNKMLSRESVKMRLQREHELTFLEFNYMVMQAYDSVKLAEDFTCQLQIGGSDQWGNIVGGTELYRKRQNLLHPDKDHFRLFGLTTPLLTTASGGKMGKTEQGAVWLNADMCTPYDYWQFWRNTEDADVGRFLRLFTDLPMKEIEKLEALDGADINQAKITLANEATAMLHGKAAANEADVTARNVFEQGGIGDDLPTVEIAKSELEAGIPAFKLFQEAGLEQSGGAARRLIKGGGAKINDVKVDDEEQVINLDHINDDGVIKLSAGKKRHALIKAA